MVVPLLPNGVSSVTRKPKFGLMEPVTLSKVGCAVLKSAGLAVVTSAGVGDISVLVYSLESFLIVEV